jgi:DNA polymerase-1
MSLLYLDIETDGLDAFNDRIVTIQLLLPSGQTIILKDPENLDNLKPILERSLVIGHNLKFDAKFLKHKFGVTLRNVYDTYLAELVISGGLYAGQSGVTGLKDLILRYCGVQVDKSQQTTFKYGIPLTEAQREYAVSDLRYLPEIVKQQKAQIELLGLQYIIDIEMKALPAIVWLELSGIHVDKDKLNSLKAMVEAKKFNAEEELYRIFGTKTINLNSTQQLKAALNNIGILVEDTKAETLARYDDAVISTIEDYKAAEKQLNTFINKIPEHINPNTGRVYANFFQIGAKSGRLSCTNPNLQQQPSKSLPEFRTIFKAEPGNKIISADYSQIELRILAQASQDEKYLIAYRNGEDLHKLTASKIFKKPLEQVSDKERNVAKSVNFGIAYGMTSFGLQRKLKKEGIDISEKEAEKVVNEFYKAYPTISKYLRTISYYGSRELQVQNIAGRLFKFNRSKNDKERRSIEKQCKNLPIQGFCADMVKIAMANIFLKLEPQGVKFINTIHDELVFECKEEQVEYVQNVVKMEMEKASSMFLKDLPSFVEISVSNSWKKK